MHLDDPLLLGSPATQPAEVREETTNSLLLSHLAARSEVREAMLVCSALRGLPRPSPTVCSHKSRLHGLSHLTARSEVREEKTISLLLSHLSGILRSPVHS